MDRLKLGKILGQGTYASVIHCTEKSTGKTFAMKVIDKARCVGEEHHIMNEIELLKQANHNNIIKLYDVFESTEKIYLQMELVKGGELFDRIVQKQFYLETDAVKLVKQILDAINYLHSINIVHRDLKPENLLMSDESDDAVIKLGDFGLSTVVGSRNQLLATTCGTLSYISPEIIQGDGYYGPPVDMWAIGVITYILLSGYAPFCGGSDAEMIEITLSGKFEFFSPEWDAISKLAKDFITRLLVIDPNARMTASDALKHPWITDASNVSATPLHVASNIKKNFNARKKLKGAIGAVKFLNKLQPSPIQSPQDLSNKSTPL